MYEAIANEQILAEEAEIMLQKYSKVLEIKNKRNNVKKIKDYDYARAYKKQFMNESVSIVTKTINSYYK
jgi:predicted nucleic-acid-binding Zn-ribbon protein